MKPYPLMYHDVTPKGREDVSGFPGRPAARYKLAPEMFAAHLRAIRQAVDEPPRLTFDDGGASAMTIADMLEGFGWRGTFFVTAGFVDRPGFMTRAHVADLAHRGHTIGSHSWTHPARMSRLDDVQLRREWDLSVNRLAEITGAPVRVGSVPGGSFGPRVAAQAAAAGIRMLFTSRPTDAVSRHGSLVVVGRYVVRCTTPAARAASVAGGAAWPRLTQAAWWEIKSGAKATLGALFAPIRARAVVEPLSP